MSLICDKCGKECKDKIGLAVHQKKCGVEKEQLTYSCPHCLKIYVTKQVLQKHILTCKVYIDMLKEEELKVVSRQYETSHKEYKLERDTEFNEYKLKRDKEFNEYEKESEKKLIQRDKEYNDYKAQRDKEFNDYKAQRDKECNEYEKESEKKIASLENKLKQLETSNKGELNMAIYDRDKCHDEIDVLKAQIKELQETKKTLERNFNDANLERKQLSNKAFTFAERASIHTPGKTIVQHVSNIHNNQRTINIQHYNPSLIVGHIVPPEVIIYSVNGLVNHIDRLGFGNFYRMSDRSRKSILWYDEQGLEIKDSKCTLMSKKLIETLRPELQIQKAYLQQEVERVKGLPTSQRSQTALNELNNTILFTTSLLDQHKTTMKALQEEIGKRAKSKHDTSVDIPKVRTYINFISQVQVALIPHIKEWIGLTSKDLGRYIAKKIKDGYAIEGASRQDDKPYIVIQDDEGHHKMITEIEFEDMWKKIIEPLVQKETVGIIEHFIEAKIDYNQENAIKAMKWLQQVSSSLFVEKPHHSFKEILHSIASTN